MEKRKPDDGWFSDPKEGTPIEVVTYQFSEDVDVRELFVELYPWSDYPVKRIKGREN